MCLPCVGYRYVGIGGKKHSKNCLVAWSYLGHKELWQLEVLVDRWWAPECLPWQASCRWMGTLPHSPCCPIGRRRRPRTSHDHCQTWPHLHNFQIRTHYQLWRCTWLMTIYRFSMEAGSSHKKWATRQPSRSPPTDSRLCSWTAVCRSNTRHMWCRSWCSSHRNLWCWSSDSRWKTLDNSSHRPVKGKLEIIFFN